MWTSIGHCAGHKLDDGGVDARQPPIEDGEGELRESGVRATLSIWPWGPMRQTRDAMASPRHTAINLG